jgi:hypothetical protein
MRPWAETTKDCLGNIRDSRWERRDGMTARQQDLAAWVAAEGLDEPVHEDGIMSSKRRSTNSANRPRSMSWSGPEGGELGDHEDEGAFRDRGLPGQDDHEGEGDGNARRGLELESRRPRGATDEASGAHLLPGSAI